MAVEFSEVVWFVADPESSAWTMKEAMGCEEVERFQDSWILLRTPGGGKLGFMRHEGKDGEPWPSPTFAFRSDNIEEDIKDLQAKGLSVSDVEKSDSMWHANYADLHGNKILIWQEPK